MANQCEKAVKIFEEQEDYQDAKVVTSMQLTGVFRSVLDKIRSKSQH